MTIDTMTMGPLDGWVYVDTPCGRANFDYPSGIEYRCEWCMAVIGSVEMSRECATLHAEQKVIDKLKDKNVRY